MSSAGSATEANSSADSSETTKAHRITDDDLYRHSTQYRLWSFTKEQLEQKRREVNQAAVDLVQKKQKDLVLNHSELTQEELDAIKEKAVPLTMEEEKNFVNFFAKKVQSFCQSLNLPTEVCATAISFFRRFFLVNSAMNIHPKHILLTSIFLACKSENYFIGIEPFAKKTKSQPSAILKYEFKLLESLHFTLLNHHPYRPLHGFFLDIQYVLRGKVDLNYMGQIYTNCKRRITDTLISDAVYHFTPPQITLACLLIEDEALTLKYLEVKFGPTPQEQAESVEKAKIEEEDKAKTEEESKKEETKKTEEGQSKDEPIEIKEEKPKPKTVGGSNLDLDKLLTLIRECQEMILKTENLSKEEATKIDARLHYCQNPMLIVERLRRQKQQRENSSTPNEPESKKLKVE